MKIPAYAVLDGTALKVSVSACHRYWLKRHWQIHREGRDPGERG
jgi:hypothetical protein